jgi:hypothetical protein
MKSLNIIKTKRWNLEHLKNCSCRPEIPKKLVEEMKRRNISSVEDIELA